MEYHIVSIQVARGYVVALNVQSVGFFVLLLFDNYIRVRVAGKSLKPPFSDKLLLVV